MLFRKITSILIALIVVSSISTAALAAQIEHGQELQNAPQSQSSVSFGDVPPTFWAYPYIVEMVSRKVIEGYPDGLFRPERTITRAEMATIILKATGLQPKSVDNSSFSDVKVTDWYSPFIEAVKDYMTGFRTADGKYIFNPAAPALREDITVAMVKLKGLDTRLSNRSSIEAMFSDYVGISENAKDYVALAVDNGLVGGYEDGTFRPQGTVTRAEAAAMLWRAYQYGSNNEEIGGSVTTAIPEQSQADKASLSDTANQLQMSQPSTVSEPVQPTNDILHPPTSHDIVISDNLLFPIRMAVVDGNDYIWDQGELKQVRDGDVKVLANIKDFMPSLSEKGLREEDLPTFRASHLTHVGNTIYVTGEILKAYEQTGSGSVYRMIMRYDNGKWDLIRVDRDADSKAWYANVWDTESVPGVIYYNGQYLYDYLHQVHTQPAVSVVGNQMFIVYFPHDDISYEAIGVIDLSDPKFPLKELMRAEGFDVAAGVNTRGAYWQGNGPEYSIVADEDQKGVTIWDGNASIYHYDILHKQMKQINHQQLFNPITQDEIMMHTKMKQYKGSYYYLNDMGIYRQDDLDSKAYLIFDPKTYRWDNKPGNIADWDIIDDHTVDILDFDNHQIIRLDMDLSGELVN